jgi:hypothetical protein
MPEQRSPEHLSLIAEAHELGISVVGYQDVNADLDALREAIARRTAEIAKEAAAKKALEDATIEELEQQTGAFDEVMGQTRGVLVRIAEWSEWIPTNPDDNEPRMTSGNGVTAFEAGEHEKVVDIEVMKTQRMKTVNVSEGVDMHYTLYAFQATLAQNVRTDLAATLIDLQGSNEEGDLLRPPQPSGLVLPDNGMPPNRAARRKRK